jgi:hypothetical protein
MGLRWQVVLGFSDCWNSSTRRAGARGGARVGRPRWLRIVTITGGSSIAVLSAKGRPFDTLRTGDDLQSDAAVGAVEIVLNAPSRERLREAV